MSGLHPVIGISVVFFLFHFIGWLIEFKSLSISSIAACALMGVWGCLVFWVVTIAVIGFIALLFGLMFGVAIGVSQLL